MKKSALMLAVIATMTANGARAESVAYGGEFVYYSGVNRDTSNGEYITRGTEVLLDTTFSAFVDQAAGIWEVSFNEPIWGLVWGAGIGALVSNEGSYAFNTSTGTVTTAPVPAYGISDGIMHFTVGPNQIAGLINLVYGVSQMTVVNVWNIDGGGGLTAVGSPAMESGPFPSKCLTFNLIPSPVPEPASAWFFGAGLACLYGWQERKRLFKKMVA